MGKCVIIITYYYFVLLLVKKRKREKEKEKREKEEEGEEKGSRDENGTTCTVLGSADPEEMFEKLGIEDETEASTVSGWVMEKTEKIPQAGDTFDFGQWHATVLKADERHVQEILLTQIQA